MTEPDMRVDWIGHERNPVVVIDDFASDPHAQRAVSAQLEFVPVPEQYYPGLRAIAPPDYFETVGATVRLALREFYGRKRVQLQQSYYSLATMPVSALSQEQRMPHFDTVFENYYAVVHFLCPPEFGGTAFFRHRSTGFETLTPERHAEYVRTLGGEIASTGLPPPAYASGSTDLFEHLATIDAHQNRAVIFRGNTLHSGAASNQMALPTDPLAGRLTVVSFLIAD